MDIGIVSMRYAKALMEYAKSMGAEDTLYKEFCMLDRSFRKHPDLRMALENPILTIREKMEDCHEPGSGILPPPIEERIPY